MIKINSGTWCTKQFVIAAVQSCDVCPCELLGTLPRGWGEFKFKGLTHELRQGARTSAIKGVVEASSYTNQSITQGN